MSKSTVSPQKPHPDFPLFPHKAGQWCKKIGGKPVYFGSIKKDPEGKAALAAYHDRLAGRTSKAEGLTVAGMCNAFLTSKTRQVDSGELVPRTVKGYRHATDLLVKFFGKSRVVETLTADDFERLRVKIAVGRGPVSTGNYVAAIKMVCKYAYASNLIENPVRLGPSFKAPSKKVLRENRNGRGVRMFEAAQVRALLAIAEPTLKAMILLGVNAGFGNSDCGKLPETAVNLKTGWLHFPRPKTGVDRRCPLWPETIEAIKASIEARPPATYSEFTGLLFLTPYGYSWTKETSFNPISREFRELLESAGFYRPGLGFYCLRRGFETIAGASRDQVAVDYLMGHTEQQNDMAAVYRQRIDDDRLQAVVDHVHAWLYPPEKKPAKRKTATGKTTKAKA